MAERIRRERELLKKWLIDFGVVHPSVELMKETQELLAQPEKAPITQREPLSEATIEYYLERLGSNSIWESGFLSGVGWAEKAHGITGIDDYRAKMGLDE